MPVTASPDEERNKGGRPIKESVVSPETIANIALGGSGRKNLSRITGIGEDAARLVLKATGHTIEEFQEIQRKKLQEVADMALEQTRDTIGKASALQSATVYGILADKLQRQPSSITQNLHIHVKESDRGDLVASLMGRHKERVSASFTNEPKPVTPAPVDPAPVIELAPSPPPQSTAGDS